MFCRPLLLLALHAPWLAIPAAYADIYVHGGTGISERGEIRLSNFPVESDYRLLVEDAPPAGVAMPAQTGAALAVPAQALPFDDAVRAAASETALEPALLHAVISVESRHDAQARSPRGAQGLMQLMPATARRFKVSDPYDPLQNIRAGARYLRELRDLYKGDMNLALAAYNAGPGAVYRSGGRIPPYAETRNYVPKVMHIYRKLSSRQM